MSLRQKSRVVWIWIVVIRVFSDRTTVCIWASQGPFWGPLAAPQPEGLSRPPWLAQVKTVFYLKTVFCLPPPGFLIVSDLTWHCIILFLMPFAPRQQSFLKENQHPHPFIFVKGPISIIRSDIFTLKSNSMRDNRLSHYVWILRLS